MEGKFIKITSKDEWENLLDKVFFKTFFHNAEWEEFLESQFKWLKFERYLYKDRVLLSLARVGKKLISHPFCEYGGPLPLVEEIDGERFKRDLFSEFKTPVKISFHPYLLSYFLCDQSQKYAIAENCDGGRVSYFIEKFPPFLRKTTRHEIEKAKTKSLQIEKCQNQQDLNHFYDLHLKSAKKHRVPAYPFSFFKYFFQSPQAEIILSKYRNRVVAGSVFLFYDNFIHYFQNAVDERYKKLGANHLILWHQMEKMGSRIFDLGGTRHGSSLQTFKEGWGGREVPIYELKNYKENDLRSSKLRNIFGILPPFLVKKLSPYLLKYKI